MNRFWSPKLGDFTEPVGTWSPVLNARKKFRYIDLSAVDQEAKAITAAALVEPQDAPSRARQLVRTNDILVSTVRPNLNAVARVTEEFDGATASTGFCVLRPSPDKVDSTYLFHWVRTPRFIEDMVRNATGASYPAVSDRIVKASLFPLPPLDEQRRIAAILDEADALRQKRKRAIALLDGLTQSIFLEIFGDPLVNDRSWPTAPIGDLLTRIDSGWSPVCLDGPAADDEWGVLKLSAVTTGQYLAAEQKALPRELDPRPALEVREGDVLFTRKNTRDLVAATALVGPTRAKLMLSDLIFRLVPGADLLPEFLWAALSYPTLRASIQSLVGGAAGSMPNISKEKLRSVTLIRPSFVVQRSFAAVVSQHRNLKTPATRSLAGLDRAFSSLQHRAFSGQL